MIEKTRLKDIGNVAVSIILLITYYFYFGKDSIERYLEKRIIITEHEEKHVTIPPPGTHLTKSCYTINLNLLQQLWLFHKISKHVTRDGSNIICIARVRESSLLNALKELPTMKLTYLQKQTNPSMLILFMLIYRGL